MKSIRTRMTIMIVLVVLGSSILLSFISYQRAKKSLITQAEISYGVAAQKYALELTSWVNTNATIIDTMAAEIAVNGISFKGYDEFHRYLRDSYLLLNKSGYVYDVYFTYPDNFMVCASDFLSDGTVDFVHAREWYTTSALTGKLFFSSPYLDSDTNKPIITISKAVYNEDKLLGVLAADIFVDVLVDMIQNADVEENSYAFLIDQHKRMIVHPDPVYAYDDIPPGVMDVPNAHYQTLMDAIAANSDDLVYVKDYDKITRGIAFSKMTNTGWYVCIATSRDAISEGVGSLLNGFVIATTVSIIIGALVVILLAHIWDKLNKQEQEYKQQVLELEKQAADEASEAKSRFLADMSHEIRTPINAIIGMNEMILRETDNKDIRGYSRNIKQSGNNLLQLINGILDFSKIEDGKMEIVPVRYNVSSQIAYFINSISKRAKTGNLEMKYDIDPELPSQLYGDDTRINQIVMNLLTNAVKYTEKGSVTLAIRALEKDEAGKKVRIHYEVKDTGIGIKESDMTRMFESFERLDVVRNRNVEGTGLGMTITKSLLELMGSELQVESTYGEGSTFSFELWQRIEDDTPLGDYQKAIRTTTDNETYKESFSAPEARILAVDDTQINVFVVQNLLKKTRVKIDTALSGPESIQLAEKNKYDVILMDQRMPGMNGTEAMKYIRESEKSLNKETPIVCLTADVVSGARERYLKQGFTDYLMKPIDGTKLEQMLIGYIPKEKVTITRVAETENPIPDLSGEEFITVLGEIGVDTNSGITLCGNEVAMYKSVLTAYAAEETTKAKNLRTYYDIGDWENYGICVHALKSASRMIGASELADLAAESEAAAKRDDAATVEKNHDVIMENYSKLAELIRNTVGSDEIGDDEIIEFAPQ